MANDRESERPVNADPPHLKGIPQPTTAFRRRAWLQFQRAIDPLAPPKPLKISRR